MTGKILRVHHDRGFCVLRSDAGVKYFAHSTAFLQSDDIDKAKVEDRVSFEPGPTTRDLPLALGIRLGGQPEREAVVSYCSKARGFVLAVEQGSCQRVFVHATAMPYYGHFEALQVGARMAFDAIEETERGPRAAYAVLLDPTERLKPPTNR